MTRGSGWDANYSGMPIPSIDEFQPSFDIPVELLALDGTNRIGVAQIRRASRSSLELSCSESHEEGQRLAVLQEGRRFAIMVSSATQQAPGAYVLAANVVTEEAGGIRAELRLPTDLAATLRVAGETEQIVVRIVDMSPSGMGLESDRALPSGADVCLSLERGLAFGQIRHCRPKAGVYSAGFILEDYLGQ